MSGSTSSTVVLEEAARLYEMSKREMALRIQLRDIEAAITTEVTEQFPELPEHAAGARVRLAVLEREPKLLAEHQELIGEMDALTRKHQAIVAAGWAGQHERDAWLSRAASEVKA